MPSSNSEVEYEFTTETVETVETDEHTHSQWAQMQNRSSRSLDDAFGLKELKAENEALQKRNSELKTQLTHFHARYEGVDVDYLEKQVQQLEVDKRKLTRDLRVAEGQATDHREDVEGRRTRIIFLEQKITHLISEQTELKEFVSEFLGLDKRTSTKTTRDLVKFIREGNHTAVASGKETDALRIKITELERLLLIERTKPPTVVAQPITSEKDMEEKLKLHLKYEQERAKYSKLVYAVQMYREESQSESEKLVEQLQSAHSQLETIYKHLRDMQAMSSDALTSTTVATSSVASARQHKCKHAPDTLFETIIEEATTYSMSSSMTMEASRSESGGSV